MKTFRYLIMMTLAFGYLFTLTGCDEDEPAALTIESIEAVGTDIQTGNETTKDLNAATAAEDVPTDAVITVMFSSEVDPNTVDPNIALEDNNENDVPVNASTNGAEVTVTPQEELRRGTQYTLIFESGLQSEDGGSLNATTRTFSTAGRSEVTPPQSANQQFYVNLNGNVEDEMNNYEVANEAAVEYVEDRFGQVGSAVYFDGDETIIEYADGENLITPSFTLSMWINVDTVNHLDANGNQASMFVFGIGNFNGIMMELHSWADFNRMKFGQSFLTENDNERAEDFTIWDLDGNLEEFEVNRGADFENLVPEGLAGLIVDQWAHVVYVYDQAENKRYCYINGTLQRSTDFDQSNIEGIPSIDRMAFTTNEQQDEPEDPEFISKRLALGFVHGSNSKMWAGEPWGSYEEPTANHYKGGMDDVRIFNVPLTAEEVGQLYNAESP